MKKIDFWPNYAVGATSTSRPC